MKKVSKQSKRRLFLLTVLLAAVTTLLVTSVFQDWVQIFKNKEEEKALSVKLQTLFEEEKSLNAEVTKLQDPEYVARYAREKYLYSKPGEIIIRIPKKTN